MVEKDLSIETSSVTDKICSNDIGIFINKTESGSVAEIRKRNEKEKQNCACKTESVKKRFVEKLYKRHIFFLIVTSSAGKIYEDLSLFAKNRMRYLL